MNDKKSKFHAFADRFRCPCSIFQLQPRLRLRSRLVARLREEAFAVLMSQEIPMWQGFFLPMGNGKVHFFTVMNGISNGICWDLQMSPLSHC
jgi:hypothetical protein